MLCVKGFVLVLALGAVLVGEDRPGLSTRSEVNYFRYLFMAMGDPEQSPETLEKRRVTFVRLLDLNEQQAAALLGATVQFRLAMGQITGAADVIVGQQQDGTADNGRVRIQRLIADRDTLISHLADSLKETLGRDGTEKILYPLRTLP